MVWGCQYDQMMLWMKANNIAVESSKPIENASKNSGKNGREVGETGIVETDKVNNIYDLLGNGIDWSLEGWKTTLRVGRRRML